MKLFVIIVNWIIRDKKNIQCLSYKESFIHQFRRQELPRNRLDTYILWLTKGFCSVSALFSRLIWKVYLKMLI